MSVRRIFSAPGRKEACKIQLDRSGGRYHSGDPDCLIQVDGKKEKSTIGAMFGFVVMMVPDVAFG